VPNIMGVLRAEIRRLARKETRQEIAALRKHVNSMRRRLAESRRRIQDLEARAKRAVKRGLDMTGGSTEGGLKQVRFSPAWVKRHRSKLGMSRRIYAKLLSVSPQTIMGWETGRTRPRRKALQTWRTIRGKGVRELRALVTGGSTTKRGKAIMRRALRGRRAAGKLAARRAALRRGKTTRLVRRVRAKKK